MCSFALAVSRVRSFVGRRSPRSRVFSWRATAVASALFLGALAPRSAGQSGCNLALQGADIGSPGAPGGESCANGVYTITGAGGGLYQRFSNGSFGDSGHLSYVSASGDVELVARVAAFAGGFESQVGLVIRESTDPSALMGSVVVRMPANPGDNPLFFNSDRHPLVHPYDNPDQGCSPTWGGSAPGMSPPYWIKLVRVGRTFSTYRSSDGVRWSPVWEYSGGTFPTAGTFLAGLFISGGQSGVTATANLDSLYIGPPRLEYETSFVGNSYSNDSAGWVSNIHAMWVGLDGRCYTNTFYDEAGDATKIFGPDGTIVGSFMFDPCLGGGAVADGSVTGDGSNLYVAFHSASDNADDILQGDLNGDHLSNPFSFASPIQRVGGMAVANGELYVSDDLTDEVVVADTTSRTETRRFPFTRCGPIAVDSRGDLWIIQRAADWPLSQNFTHPYVGAVRCFHPDGTFSGREITDVVNPSGLCIDPNLDRLLVCENGPDQNIRIYTDLANAPAATGSFGTVGGVYGSGVAGQLDDPAHGGDQRLFGPFGVGLDGSGNLYVACGAGNTTLRKYDSGGTLLWSVSALPFQDCVGFDPTTDGQDLYWKNGHWTMDYSRTTPGSEWSLTSTSWNPFGTEPATNRAIGGETVRRLGPNHDRFAFRNLMAGLPEQIFRFSGEIMVPCAEFGADGNGLYFWSDANGDGVETPNERTYFADQLGSPASCTIGDSGDLFWLHASGYAGQLGHQFVERFHMSGLNSFGAPIYDVSDGNHPSIAVPPQIAYPTSMRYDEAGDAMYVLGTEAPNVVDQLNVPFWVGVWDHWSRGAPVLRFARELPHPTFDPNFIQVGPPYPTPEGFQYFGMDAVGGMIFAAEFWGPIHVLDARMGNEVTRLMPGPEVSGVEAFNDVRSGVQAFRRSTGEFVVAREDSGYRARCLTFRWTPHVVATPAAPTNLVARGSSNAIRLNWDGGNGLTRNYTVWRGSAAGSEVLLADKVQAPTYLDGSVRVGSRYFYRVTASNEDGSSGFSNEASASATASAHYLGYDLTTIGSWHGVYGSHGAYVIGDAHSFPSGVQCTVTGHYPPAPPDDPAGVPSNNPEDLQTINGSGRISASWNQTSDPPRLTVDLDIVDGRAKTVAFYFLWGGDITVTIDARDTEGNLLGSHTISHFGASQGRYEIFRATGHVRFVIWPDPNDSFPGGIGLHGFFVDEKTPGSH